eukprot:4239296-Pyramimonas_sp.AAC.1
MLWRNSSKRLPLSSWDCSLLGTYNVLRRFFGGMAGCELEPTRCERTNPRAGIRRYANDICEGARSMFGPT